MSPSSLSRPRGPIIAATDYMKNYAEQIRAFVPNRFTRFWAPTGSGGQTAG